MPIRLPTACKKLDDTNYRREKQIGYNTLQGMGPMALNKSLGGALSGNSVSTQHFEDKIAKAAEPESLYLSKPEIEKKIRDARKAMEKAAKELDFMQAAKLRDEIKSLQEKI
jgi:excinuclease ABC subunit B